MRRYCVRTASGVGMASGNVDHQAAQLEYLLTKSLHHVLPRCSADRRAAGGSQVVSRVASWAQVQHH